MAGVSTLGSAALCAVVPGGQWAWHPGGGGAALLAAAGVLGCGVQLLNTQALKLSRAAPTIAMSYVAGEGVGRGGGGGGGGRHHCLPVFGLCGHARPASCRPIRQRADAHLAPSGGGGGGSGLLLAIAAAQRMGCIQLCSTFVVILCIRLPTPLPSPLPMPSCVGPAGGPGALP